MCSKAEARPNICSCECMHHLLNIFWIEWYVSENIFITLSSWLILLKYIWTNDIGNTKHFCLIFFPDKIDKKKCKITMKKRPKSLLCAFCWIGKGSRSRSYAGLQGKVLVSFSLYALISVLVRMSVFSLNKGTKGNKKCTWFCMP